MWLWFGRLSCVTCSIHLHFNNFIFFFLSPESMPKVHPENRYAVMHLHIHAHNVCTLIRYINKSISVLHAFVSSQEISKTTAGDSFSVVP